MIIYIIIMCIIMILLTIQEFWRKMRTKQTERFILENVKNARF